MFANRSYLNNGFKFLQKLVFFCLFTLFLFTACNKDRYHFDTTNTHVGENWVVLNNGYKAKYVKYPNFTSSMTIFDAAENIFAQLSISSSEEQVDMLKYVYEKDGKLKGFWKFRIGYGVYCDDYNEEEEIEKEFDIDYGDYIATALRIVFEAKNENPKFEHFYFKYLNENIVEVYDPLGNHESIKAKDGSYLEFRIKDYSEFVHYRNSDIVQTEGIIGVLFEEKAVSIPNDKSFSSLCYYGYRPFVSKQYVNNELSEYRLFPHERATWGDEKDRTIAVSIKKNDDGSVKASVKISDYDNYNKNLHVYTFKDQVMIKQEEVSTYGTVLWQVSCLRTSIPNAYNVITKNFDYTQKKLITEKEERYYKDVLQMCFCSSIFELLLYYQNVL